MFRYRFKKSGHINVNEARTYKSFLKAAAKTEPDSRLVGILDSRVTIGAAAKGRSSSFAISRIFQGCLPYIIGSGLYPGLLHCYSDMNRSDGPSRDGPVAPPSRAIPSWFEDLEQGRTEKFDAVVASSCFFKECGAMVEVSAFASWRHRAKPWSYEGTHGFEHWICQSYLRPYD